MAAQLAAPEFVWKDRAVSAAAVASAETVWYPYQEAPDDGAGAASAPSSSAATAGDTRAPASKNNTPAREARAPIIRMTPRGSNARAAFVRRVDPEKRRDFVSCFQSARPGVG